MLSNIWKTLSASVRGASHIRTNLPNQDAVAIKQPIEGELPIIVAIADGHGSSKSFRSDRGSDYAVKAAINTLSEFILNTKEINNNSSIKRIAEEQLPKEMVKRWLEIVEHDIEHKPLSEEEFRKLKGQNEIVAYGTTLLAAVFMPSFIVFLQIGDGDILFLTDQKNIERPIPKDERLIANETTSLCSKNAWRDFFCIFKPVSNHLPLLIMLSTDGYSNSFSRDEDFEKVSIDLYNALENEGITYIEQQLEGWLNESSEKGSGDDITIGIISYLPNKVSKQ